MRYGIAAVMLGGATRCTSPGWKKHIGLYPVPTLDEPLESEIAPYRAEKDSVVFPHSKPVPYELIGRVTEAIVAQRPRRQPTAGASAASSLRPAQHAAGVPQHRLVDHASLVGEDAPLALGRGQHRPRPRDRLGVAGDTPRGSRRPGSGGCTRWPRSRMPRHPSPRCVRRFVSAMSRCTASIAALPRDARGEQHARARHARDVAVAAVGLAARRAADAGDEVLGAPHQRADVAAAPRCDRPAATPLRRLAQRDDLEAPVDLLERFADSALATMIRPEVGLRQGREVAP